MLYSVPYKYFRILFVGHETELFVHKFMKFIIFLTLVYLAHAQQLNLFYACCAFTDTPRHMLHINIMYIVPTIDVCSSKHEHRSPYDLQ